MDDTFAELLAANDAHVAERDEPGPARPGRQLAVLTCMDARLDVVAALGVRRGDAHVLRNAGGRVTDDVLRSVALSSHVFGVDTVILMQHTQCGLAGASEEALRQRTGADIPFLAFDDHGEALREDIERLVSAPFLATVQTVVGFVYDVDTGAVEELARWERT